mmetsp:Transcript_3547/g.2910  ORF Transcript_3547/g.2910 Transcript_3547/m.2910 type:complete len:101 (+) Transcript_3547:82-384(+)
MANQLTLLPLTSSRKKKTPNKTALLGICVFLVPESPRWLAEHNKVDQATKVLLRLRGSKSIEEDPEITEEVRAYEETAEHNAKSISKKDTNSNGKLIASS